MTKRSGRLIAAAAFACIAGTIWWRIDEYQDLSFSAVMSLMTLALLSAGAAVVLAIAGAVGARARTAKPEEPANRGAALRAAMKDARRRFGFTQSRLHRIDGTDGTYRATVWFKDGKTVEAVGFGPEASVSNLILELEKLQASTNR